MNRFISITITITLFLLSGCTATFPLLTASPLSPTLTEIHLLPTSTLAPSQTPTASASPFPTATPLPSETPAPTATLTPDLPVGIDSALPLPSVPISMENVTHITELARYGAARVYETHLSADMDVMFTLTSEGVKVYQAGTRERLAWFPGLQPLSDEWGNKSWHFTSSADGQRFAFLAPGYQAQVFDLQAGLIYTQTLPAEWSSAPSISKDGLFLAVPKALEEDWISRWQVVDLPGGSVVAEGIGESPAFSHAGKYLAATSGFNIFIYGASDWQEKTQIGLSGGGGQTATHWVFSPNDRYLAVVLSDRITIWEVESRKRVREVIPLSGEGAEFQYAGFSEDGRTLGAQESYQGNWNLVVWDIADGSPLPQETVQQEGYSMNGDILLSSDSGLVLQTAWKEEPSDYQSPFWQGDQVAFDLGGDRLSVIDISGWNFDKNHPLFKTCVFLFSQEGQLQCQDVDGPKGVASDGNGNYYSLWQTEQAEEALLHRGLAQSETALVTFPTDGWEVQLQAVSPDHKSFVYTLNTTLQVRDLPSGKVRLTVDLGGRLRKVQYSPDGLRLVVAVVSAASSHAQIFVYDLIQNAITFRLPVRDMQYGTSAALSPQGDRLAYRFQRTDAYHWSGIVLVDPQHQRVLAEVEGDETALGNPVAFSPDGQLLAAANDQGDIFFLDPANGEVLYSWKAHTDVVTSLAFSSDGRLLATSGADGFVHIWGIWY